MSEKKVCMVIIDGFGLAEPSEGNAITLAKTPTWDYLTENYPWIPINASGNYVGLPDGIMGNSEVGHLAIGTGRTTYQSLELINRACDDGSIGKNPTIELLLDHLTEFGGDLHLMGLLSDGAVHSHQEHLYKMIDIFSNKSDNNIWIHALMDGRDTPPDSGIDYIKQLDERIKENNSCKLSSVIGRYYAMDRDKKWDRTKIAYDMFLNMEKSDEVTDVFTTMKQRYDNEETDEFLKPIICDAGGRFKENDAILFFNFRPDRARQITMLVNGIGGIVTRPINNLLYATMTEYEGSWNFPTLFQSEVIEESLAETISKENMSQIHIAETEKYAHVTYFFNGGREELFPNEERKLIPSLKVATYDLEPSMSTNAIAEATVNAISKERHSVVIINIAAPDMVGHSGLIPATKEALVHTDNALKMIYDACLKYNYTMIVTSDHGNCEKMLHHGKPHTAHTTNPVPFLIVDKDIIFNSNISGLADIAPTILDILGIDQPELMTGHSMIK